jgi:hypothetical protein
MLWIGLVAVISGTVVLVVEFGSDAAASVGSSREPGRVRVWMPRIGLGVLLAGTALLILIASSLTTQ